MSFTQAKASRKQDQEAIEELNQREAKRPRISNSNSIPNSQKVIIPTSELPTDHLEDIQDNLACREIGIEITLNLLIKKQESIEQLSRELEGLERTCSNIRARIQRENIEVLKVNKELFVESKQLRADYQTFYQGNPSFQSQPPPNPRLQSSQDQGIKQGQLPEEIKQSREKKRRKNQPRS